MIAQGEEIEPRARGSAVPGWFVEHVQTVKKRQSVRHVAPPREGDAAVEIGWEGEEEVEPAGGGFEVLGEELVALGVGVVG